MGTRGLRGKGRGSPCWATSTTSSGLTLGPREPIRVCACRPGSFELHTITTFPRKGPSDAGYEGSEVGGLLQPHAVYRGRIPSGKSPATSHYDAS